MIHCICNLILHYNITLYLLGFPSKNLLNSPNTPKPKRKAKTSTVQKTVSKSYQNCKRKNKTTPEIFTSNTESTHNQPLRSTFIYAPTKWFKNIFEKELIKSFESGDFTLRNETRLIKRPRISQIRVSNTRLVQAASGCAPSVDVLPIFDVKQQSVRNPARMGANQPSRFSYNKRLGTYQLYGELYSELYRWFDTCRNFPDLHLQLVLLSIN
ncbi:hypothetical protein WN51_04113 [Melipona quadrifasciata]|uniref:Uncharacterized protein n=1 Tax=Melipona quadrifasciata TaxID=166423 RepID=A0A0M8ZQ38_9HYME|nr:hypothetical protein WN51_04113 [Melipona quadrifasciata]